MKKIFVSVVGALCAMVSEIQATTVVVEPVSANAIIKGDEYNVFGVIRFSVTAEDSDIWVPNLVWGDVSITSTSPPATQAISTTFVVGGTRVGSLQLLLEGQSMLVDVGVSFGLEEDGFGRVDLNSVDWYDGEGWGETVLAPPVSTPWTFVEGSGVPEPGITVLVIGFGLLIGVRRRR
jgi:hypothetical protein